MREQEYLRHTTVVDVFADGTEEISEHAIDLIPPPCEKGFGCSAAPMPTQKKLPNGEFEYGSGGPCRFDPKTGLCGGQMP